MFGEGSTIRRRRLWASPVAVKGYRMARRAAEKSGLQLVLKTYYSPIPDLDQLPAEAWSRRDPLHGLHFDLDAQMAFVRLELGEHLSAFEAVDDVAPEHQFERDNSSYSVPDARILYSMIRHFKPARVVELGSGQTTRVIARACRDNAAAGASVEFRAYDPFPTAVDDSLPGLDELGRVKAEALPEAVVTELRDGDVLFVDTTHIVKIGSDVNHIVLRLLPLLSSGVVVHFHDVFLPYEYPRFFFDDFGLYWNEQYLLQAFLAFNGAFEVVCAVNALVSDRAEEMAATGVIDTGEIGSGFWIRRN